MKRLLLYVHFDADGRLDPHIHFQISRLKDEGFSIVFISNSPLKEDDRNSLVPLVDRVVLRPNKGFDFGAWKEVILDMGKDGLARWDELLLMNSTCYGPLFPLKDVFQRMAEVPCDFWGLTRHVSAEGMPDHLQSYFMVLKRKVFLSEVFFDFWKKLSMTESVPETIKQGEVQFSQTLIQAGFSASVYADCEDDRWNYEINYRPNLSFFAANFMLRHYKIPFVKVKAFYASPAPSLDAPATLLARIAAETSFPTELIVAHQRRAAPIATQRRIPGTVLVLQPDVESHPVAGVRIAVLLHMFYAESCHWLFSLLENIPCRFDCYISVCSEDVKREVQSCHDSWHPQNMQQCNIRIVENRGRDILPWLQSFNDVLPSYDLVLKMHSKKSPHVCSMFSELWRDWIADSLLNSPYAVNQIIAAFEKDPALGVVLPPYPPVLHVQKQLFYKGAVELKESFAFLREQLGLSAPSEIRAPYFPAGSMFWYRPAALQALHGLQFARDDFPDEPIGVRETMAHAIERIILYAAQAAGYSYRLAISEQNLADTFLLYEDLLIKRSEDGVIVSSEELLNENRRLQQHLSLILNSRAWKLVEKLRSIKRRLSAFLPLNPPGCK